MAYGTYYYLETQKGIDKSEGKLHLGIVLNKVDIGMSLCGLPKLWGDSKWNTDVEPISFYGDAVCKRCKKSAYRTGTRGPKALEELFRF